MAAAIYSVCRWIRSFSSSAAVCNPSPSLGMASYRTQAGSVGLSPALREGQRGRIVGVRVRVGGMVWGGCEGGE